MSVSVDSLNLQGHYFVLRKACYNTNPKHLEDYAHPWIEGETEEQEHQSLLCLWDMVAGVGWDLKVFPKHVLKSEEGHTAIRYDAIEQEAQKKGHREWTKSALVFDFHILVFTCWFGIWSSWAFSAQRRSLQHLCTNLVSSYLYSKSSTYVFMLNARALQLLFMMFPILFLRAGQTFAPCRV